MFIPGEEALEDGELRVTVLGSGNPWPTRAQASHTSPKAAGKVLSLVKPRLACLWHTLLSPEVVTMLFAELGEVYQGPVLQTQDLTVINITKAAIVSRQAQVESQ